LHYVANRCIHLVIQPLKPEILLNWNMCRACLRATFFNSRQTRWMYETIILLRQFPR